jgi:hypothetical protein
VIRELHEALDQALADTGSGVHHRRAGQALRRLRPDPRDDQGRRPRPGAW